jgi:hypothetical protein
MYFRMVWKSVWNSFAADNMLIVVTVPDWVARGSSGKVNLFGVSPFEFSNKIEENLICRNKFLS